jgi:tetratricopeptide (TPR) repeat protein
MKINNMIKIFTALCCFLFVSSIFGQEKTELFPQNINLENYTQCKCSDTTAIKQKIDEIDFEGERYSYDYSQFKFVDINNNGICEVLHYFSSGLRGWPYDYLTIYIIGDTLNKIGDFPSFLYFAESDGHYLQLNYGYIEGHKTNPIYYNSVWRFNGEEYAPYYCPHMTKGEFKTQGTIAYKNKKYEKAYIYFNNALLTPHHSENQLLESANDVAITLIKLNRADEVQPLLLKYLDYYSENDTKASAYYNIGLAMEKLHNDETALINFEKSCKYKKTEACKTKIKEIENRNFDKNIDFIVLIYNKLKNIYLYFFINPKNK